MLAEPTAVRLGHFTELVVLPKTLDCLHHSLLRIKIPEKGQFIERPFHQIGRFIENVISSKYCKRTVRPSDPFGETTLSPTWQSLLFSGEPGRATVLC